jgi:hypothetical protein
MTSTPLNITFDGLKHSNILEAKIRERVGWLEQFYPRIVGCRVLVEVPHRHHHRGRHFHIRVDIAVPGGGAIVVSDTPSLHRTGRAIGETAHRKKSEIDGAMRDASMAIHQAFDIARRRLQDFAREQRAAPPLLATAAAT